LHLAVGTHQQNVDDNKLNGHKRKKKTILSLSDKRRIIKNKTITNQELAEKYNVPVRTIYKIKQDAKNGKTFTSKDKPSISNKRRANQKKPSRK
jgi:predicted transcriptional regulator